MNLFTCRKICGLFLFIAAEHSFAAIPLGEKNDWKVSLGGFVALHMYDDSTRGFGESLANRPTARKETISGDHGSLQFSIRHSRLSFTILPPPQDDWQSKAYFEFDLLGYQGNPESTVTNESRSSTSPTFRVRHAYFNLNRENFTVLAGQTWTVFGFVPDYVLSTISVAPGPATLFQRAAQVRVKEIWPLNEKHKLELLAAVARPSQRDSESPNLDCGLRWKYSGLSAHYASATSDSKVQPLSAAISGTFRQFKLADSPSGASSSKLSGAALALNIALPLIPTNADGSSLILASSYTSGKGYADALPGWTGNLARGSAASGVPAGIDAGQGGWDSSGKFKLIPLRTWNAQVQYHLATSRKVWLSAGYAKFWSAGVDALESAKASLTRYDGLYFYFLNVVHDITGQIRIGAEYSHDVTHYIDGTLARNDRYQVSAYFRF